jgi:hypothetical protein
MAVAGSCKIGITRAFHPVQRIQQYRHLIATTLVKATSSQVGTPATAFDDGQRPYQITTPIYYVNDKPHIGHAYTSTGTVILSSAFFTVKDYFCRIFHLTTMCLFVLFGPILFASL